MPEQEIAGRHGQLQSLKATRINACTKCSAPGVFRVPQNVQEFEWYKQWPKIVVTLESGLKDKPVGSHCPQCGEPRSPALTQDLGTIWRRFVPWGGGPAEETPLIGAAGAYIRRVINSIRGKS